MQTCDTRWFVVLGRWCVLWIIAITTSYRSITDNQLRQELSEWLATVKPAEEQGYDPPVAGCKAIIAPCVNNVNHGYPLKPDDVSTRHAGYSYSGQAAAWAYKSINTTGM